MPRAQQPAAEEAEHDTPAPESTPASAMIASIDPFVDRPRGMAGLPWHAAPPSSARADQRALLNIDLEMLLNSDEQA